MLKQAITFLVAWGFFGSCAYAAEPVTIRLQVVPSPFSSVLDRGTAAFQSAVNEKLGTAGRVELVNVPGNPLESLRSGKADLVAVSSSALVDLKATENFALFDLPFLF